VVNGSQQELELAIYTSDDAVVQSLLSNLTGLDTQRPRRARVIDPITLITVASAAVTLVTGLLDLRDRLRAEPSAPEVVVRNERGDSVSLTEASEEDIGRLVQP
jgi:hypothetical protein